jgi:hypothetical protein
MRIWEVTCRGGRGGETRGATGPDRPGCRSIARGRVRWGHGRRSGRGGGCRARSRAGIARASLRAHHQTPKPPKRTAVSKTFERECRRTDLPKASAPTRHPTRAVEDGRRTCQPCAPARRVRGWSPVSWTRACVSPLEALGNAEWIGSRTFLPSAKCRRRPDRVAHATGVVARGPGSGATPPLRRTKPRRRVVRSGRRRPGDRLSDQPTVRSFGVSTQKEI